jgi:hypothetical protein
MKEGSRITNAKIARTLKAAMSAKYYRNRNCIQNSSRKPEEKGLLRRPVCNWENNIRIDVKKIGLV